MGLLDRYSSTSTNEEQATQSAFANHESSDKIRPALEDRYSDVKARIHSMIIEQQLGSDNADVSDEGMRKLIDEYVERPAYGIWARRVKGLKLLDFNCSAPRSTWKEKYIMEDVL